jgi:hypothetical protein
MWVIAAISDVLKRKRLCSTLLFVCLTQGLNCSVIAEDGQYSCVVVAASKLKEEGALAPHRSMKSFIGEQFTVDRETGRITGGPLDNSHMKIQLIDKGSREMSFQVIAQSNQRTHTTQLEIEEFQPTESKPFIGTTTLHYPGVYTGTCK